MIGASASLAQTGTTPTAFSTPAGFVTHTLRAGQFNLIGLTLHEAVVVAGQLDSVNGTTLGDNDVDFTTALTDGTTYILEITNATSPERIGTIQEVASWTANTFETGDDLGAQGLVAGDTYQLRPAATLQQVFGEPAQIGASFTEIGADVVWLPDGAGDFTRYFYQGAPLNRWFNATTGNAVTEGIPIIYTDAFFVQVRSTNDVDLVVTGNVKISNVNLAVFTGFNTVSGVFPVGSTLANSSLQAGLTASFTEIGADVLWLPDGAGDFTRYFYQGTPLNRWFNASTNTAVADPSVVVLPSAFFIQRRGATADIGLTPPESYDDL